MNIVRCVSGCLFVLLLWNCLLLASPAYAGPQEPFPLSAGEKAYVAQAAPVQVAVVLNWQPFMYRGRNGSPQGIVFDILEKTAALTALRFAYVPVQTHDEAMQLVSEGKLDLLGGMILNAKQQTNLTLLPPYTKALNLLVSARDIKGLELGQLTASQLRGSPLLHAEQARQMLDYPSLEKSLEAIRNGRADYTRINTHTAQMLLWQLGTTGFVVQLLPEEEVHIGFGVSPVADKNLASLLEKSLHAITPTEQQAMLARHTLQPWGTDSSWLNFIYLHAVELLCAALPLMIAILIGFFIYFRIRMQHNQKISGYEESYRLLANTLGEVGIEYDYITDKVTFFGRSRDMLTLDAHIESFREKLKTQELPLSLTLDEFNQVLQNGVAGKSSVVEFQCQLREKGWAWFQLVCTVVCTEESHRRPVRLIGCLVNVDAERRERALLRDLSQTDPPYPPIPQIP